MEKHNTEIHESVTAKETFYQKYRSYFPASISFILLIAAVIFEQTDTAFFRFPVNLIWNIAAYLFVGLPINIKAVREIRHGNVFSEFFLMSLATIGAFFIGEYSEGVAVMLFYTIGELFQDAAVDNATKSIKALLDIRPDTVTVIRGKEVVVNPSEVEPGEIIQVKPGEKVALDGELLSETASFNTSALTGESRPDTISRGQPVLAGMINLNTIAEVKVTALFKDSKLSKILEMVQDATSKKSKTQLFISRFAKIYTPIVVFLAIGILCIPYLFVEQYVFSTWLYRALVFLVISCPCALVVSIPLGYFGGIGLASRKGILFKGGNYMDVMTKVDTVVMDKTGTLTKGVFKVQEVITNNFNERELLTLTAALENKSTHPIARAVVQYAGEDAFASATVENVEEIAGHGLTGTINSKKVLAGNLKLLKKFNISYDKTVESNVETIVVVAVDNQYAGYITIADEIKEDAKEAIEKLHKLGIKTVMLSGDKQSIVDKVAKTLGIDTAFGDLLPENKVEKVQQLKNQNRTLVFVGDGVNDAPVVALADVGMAMGGLGSDATIETADVVIQNDQPGKIATAIEVGKITRRIVLQNISLAFGVKVVVLILGAGGLANLWEAVFADVGVALLAILNAIRIQKTKL